MERDPQSSNPETSDGPAALRHPLELVQALSLKLDAGLATGLLTESDSSVNELRGAISADELLEDIQWSIHKATETPRSVSAINAVRTLAAAARRELLSPETIAGLLGQIREAKFRASLSQSLVAAAQRGQQGDGRDALTAVDGLAASLYLEKNHGDVLTAQDAKTILSLLNQERPRALLWREIGTLLAQGTTTAELRRRFSQSALGDTPEARQGCAGVAAVQYLATLSK